MAPPGEWGGLGEGLTLLSGPFAGREEFAQQVRNAFAVAAAQGWEEVILCDSNFADWPLGEREVIGALNAWARSGRRLTMLARQYDEVVRRHARFVHWRCQWDHLIECRKSPSASALQLPSVLWSPVWMMHRVDPERCRGVCGSDLRWRVLMRENLNEWLHSRSSPGFPATTLGL